MGSSFSEEESQTVLSSPSAAPTAQISNPLRQKRLTAEAKRCTALTLERDGICVDAGSAGLDAPWTAYIQGPLGTVWEGGVFKVEISFPSRYPWQPLRLRFVDSIFHPNVAEDGAICNRLAGDHWSPALGPGAMLIYTRALLANPNYSARDLGEEGTEQQMLEADARARQLGGLGQPQKLYHYTYREAMTSIMNSWELKPSARGIAGPGIYVTALHPTNCTKAEITSNNWGGYGSDGGKTDFVIELDVSRLQEQGYTVETVAAERDVWIIKPLAGLPSLRLDDSNSTVSDFDKMSTCLWNRDAGALFRENQLEYHAKVMETIQAFGQHMVGVRKQKIAHDEK